MFLWFCGLSFVAVWLVFSTPTLDYRLVMLGAVLPVAELPFGEPRVLHGLVAPVAGLTIVMLMTTRRRLVRRRWLGLPIGAFMHLVLDFVWTDTEAFWWPLSGRFSSADLPELARGALNVPLEVAGAVALWWCWRAFGLDDRARRARFIRTGQLDRDLTR